MTARPDTGLDQPFGIFTVDARLVVRTWDRWIAEATGIPADAALNRPLIAILPNLEERGVVTLLRGVLERGTVEVLSPALHRFVIECAPRSPSAMFDRMQQHVSIGPLREEGRIVGAIVTVEDVTARIEHDRAQATSVESVTNSLGDPQWTSRQRGVRQLARQGHAIVDTLVQTLRQQHQNFSVLSSVLDLLAITDLDVVEPLIACLADPDVDLRIQAALILGERRDPRAIPVLMRALDDPDTNVRFHAIEALGRLHATDAVDSLLRIAETREFFLAFPSIQALARLGDASIARRVVPLLGDAMLSAAAVEALGNLGDDDVVEPLVQLVGEPHAPVDAIAEALSTIFARYEHRYGAGDQIATIVRRAAGAAATQNFLDAVQRVTADRLPGLARVLGWLDGPAVQRALARLLAQPTVRTQVVEALVRHGAGVVGLLVEQLRADDLETRQAAAVALGRIGDTEATAALVTALEDRELAVAAAGALARIGDRAAFGALMGLVGDEDSAIRQAAIAALNSIGHPEMPAHVVRLLHDPSALVRESAVRIAGYFGYGDCLTGVLECCADSSETVRRAAVEQLPMFDDARAIERLVTALSSDTPAVRAAAASAFARADAEVAVDPLLQALRDGDPWVRYFALRSLGTFRHAAAAGAVRERLEHDAAGQVRLAAIDVLGRLQPPEILSLLEPLAMSDDTDTARAAIRAMGYVTSPAAQSALDALMRAPEEWRRLEAVTAVGGRNSSDAVATLQWTAAADESNDVAAAAIAALAVLGSRDDDTGAEATKALIALMAEPSRREWSIAALGRLPAFRADDVAAGLAHQSLVVRRACVDALSRMRHTAATRWIETALNDQCAAVRAAAVAELRRLGSRHAARKLVMLARTDPDPAVRSAATMATSGESVE